MGWHGRGAGGVIKKTGGGVMSYKRERSGGGANGGGRQRFHYDSGQNPLKANLAGKEEE